MDWATPKVLTWWLSNTLDASFCVEALEEAIAKYGTPEIMNTDPGSQYTGAGWITTLSNADIKISMDGRGQYLDNIFIERLWRSLKQEAVYLPEITDGFQAKRIIDNWVGFCNSERSHTALDKRTPDISHTLAKRRHEKRHKQKQDASYTSRQTILKIRSTSHTAKTGRSSRCRSQNKMLREVILFVGTYTTLSHASHHNLFLGYLGQLLNFYAIPSGNNQYWKVATSYGN